MSSYQHRKSHCGDKTVVRSAYLHNGISYTGKMTFLYWFATQNNAKSYAMIIIATMFSTGGNFHVNQTRQIWGIWKLRLAYSPETPNLGQNRWCFVPCDLEIWRMTLENDRASLLCCFKLCATFHSHWWIQTWVTVRKHPFWVKFDDF